MTQVGRAIEVDGPGPIISNEHDVAHVGLHYLRRGLAAAPQFCIENETSSYPTSLRLAWVDRMSTNKLWLEHPERAAWESVQAIREKLKQSEKRLQAMSPPVEGWERLLD